MPDDHVLGEIDGAWKQATSELAYERSGPERFLETFYVLTELIRALGAEARPAQRRRARPPGRAAAYAAAHVGLGRRHAAGRQGAGGGRLDRQGPRHHLGAEAARTACASSPPSSSRRSSNRATLEEQLAFATMIAPKLTIQGGTTEILRGIIARGLGLAVRGEAAVPDIGKLLWPRSVAVVGASSEHARPARPHLRRSCAATRYAGQVYPVSRSAAEVQGLKAYPSVDALPQAGRPRHADRSCRIRAGRAWSAAAAPASRRRSFSSPALPRSRASAGAAHAGARSPRPRSATTWR